MKNKSITAEIVHRVVLRTGDNSNLIVVRRNDEIEIISEKLNVNSCDTIARMSPEMLGEFLAAVVPLSQTSKIVIEEPKTAQSFSGKATRKVVKTERRYKPWNNEEAEMAGRLLNEGFNYKQTGKQIGRSFRAVRIRHQMGKIPNCPYTPDEFLSLRGKVANLHKLEQRKIAL